MFSVNATSGEGFKLRASDGKERQFWVDKLRQVSQMHENRQFMFGPDELVIGDKFSSQTNATSASTAAAATAAAVAKHASQSALESSSTLDGVQDIIEQTNRFERSLSSTIESLTCTDRQLLTIKAISSATVASLSDCFHILQTLERDSHRTNNT